MGWSHIHKWWLKIERGISSEEQGVTTQHQAFWPGVSVLGREVPKTFCENQWRSWLSGREMLLFHIRWSVQAFMTLVIFEQRSKGRLKT